MSPERKKNRKLVQKSVVQKYKSDSKIQKWFNNTKSSTIENCSKNKKVVQKSKSNSKIEKWFKNRKSHVIFNKWITKKGGELFTTKNILNFVTTFRIVLSHEIVIFLTSRI